MTYLASFLWLALAIFVVGHISPASATAPSPLDGFYPNVNGQVYALAVQEDGNIILGGDFTKINGTTCNRIARLNADGSLDTTFSLGTGANKSVHALALQPDGKVLLGGLFTNINNTSCSCIARLNADGSLDSTFNTGTGADNSVDALALQTDGKVLLGGHFTSINGTGPGGIARLNTNGSLDTTFDPGSGTDAGVHALALQADGKVLLGGDFTTFNGKARKTIARLNANGSLDATFNPGTGADLLISALALQADGKVLLGGTFTSINGTARMNIARLNANGSLDTSFNHGNGVTGSGGVQSLALQADGKVLLGGNFTTVNGSNGYANIARLNADGSLDANFHSITGMFREVDAVAVQADGKVLLGGYITSINYVAYYNLVRLNVDGSLDRAYNPGLGADTWASAMAAQADGKVLLGGNFKAIYGMGYNRIARLNGDGNLDTTFKPGTGANDNVAASAVQADGKLLVGGKFTSINGTARNHIARLNADGTVDTTYLNPATGMGDMVLALALQTDGKVLLGVAFSTTTGTMRGGRIVRLNADGSLDPTFNPGPDANDYIYSLAVQADGKVLVGGKFTAINGMARNCMTRLSADGSVDATFKPGTGASDTVLAWAVQPDGMILLGGNFTSINDTARNRVARLNANGSLDTTFDPGLGASNSVIALALQADGKVLLGGTFTSINNTARNRVARLGVNGSLDTAFDPGTGANDDVAALALQSDGKVLLSGNFISFNGVARNQHARLTNPDAARQVLTVAPDGGSVTWALGGSFPQPCQALFEQSADGTSNTWKTLGWGVAVPGVGYRFSGLNLPVKTNCYLRVTGWATGGSHNGSASLHRSGLQYYGIPAQYTLTYLAGANGSIDGATSATQMVGRGSSGTVVMAVPDPGYHFTQWSDTRTDNPRTDTDVPTTITVTAAFATGPYTLTYTAGGHGSIDGATSRTLTADHGTSAAAVTAVPATGYHFTQWSDGKTANPRIDTNVTTNKSITVSFAINQYTLAYIAGAHGSINGATSRTQTLDRGTSGTPITAVPSIGYHFTQWNDTRTDNPRTDTNVTTNVAVTAVFTINQYTQTYMAGAHGSIDGATSKTQTVSYGASGLKVTAVPATGYHFVQWSDGVQSATRTDTNVTTSKSVTATFAINQYNLTYTAGANGTINGATSKTQTVNYGASGAAMAAVPATGYHFVQWSDGVQSATRTDTNVTTNKSVTATFAINQYTVTFRTDGRFGATLSGAFSQTVNYSGKCSAVTAKAPAGSYFVKWTKNGAAYSTRNPLTVTGVTETITLIAVFGPDDAVKEWSDYE